MAGLGAPELIIILIIFVLLFGAKKLPDLGSSIGKGIKNFKKGVDEGGQEHVDDGATVASEPVTAVPLETGTETGLESAERLRREQRVE